jgi:Fic family protein
MQGFGQYEPDEHGRLCYRPPQPPFPSMDDVWEQHERAVRAVGNFDRALGVFPVSGVIGKLFARLDAVHSSGAEGSTTTFTDLLEYQSSLGRARDPADAESVAACAAAFDEFAAGVVGRPTKVILAIHRRLFERNRDPVYAAAAGQWKTHPNGIFDPDLGGAFHYTRPSSLPEALKEWEAFTTAANGRPELVRQALSHWMFEHIHPVPDGNGRVGRLLVPLLLRHKGVALHACAFMGEAVHHDKELYVQALKHARRTGDMGSWSRVCLSLIAQTATANSERLERLGGIYARWRHATKGVRSHSVVHQMAPWILTKPKFTVTDAVAAMGQTFASVNTAVARLKDLGIVSQVGASGKDRLFAAEEVIRLFEPLARPAARS